MKKTKVYIAGTNVLHNDALFEKLYSEVSTARQKKIDSYAFREDKNLSLGAEILLRSALQNEGISHYEVEYDKNGKPYLKNQSDIFFSLSHSGEMVMCAVSGAEVGCDTEKIRNVNLKIANRFFCENEWQQIATGSTEQEKADTFFRLWTLKESYMKMTGLGMKLKFDSFSFDISGECPKIQQSKENEMCFFKEFDFNDGYKYAVCSAFEDIPNAVFVNLDNTKDNFRI